MKIIGHRGAAGLAGENSIASIKAAKKAGVDAIEIDVRLSKDGKLFLCHDLTLNRTHEVDEKIGHLTSTEIKKIKGPDGDHVPTLEEALKACGDIPVVIEGKSVRWAKPLANALAKHPNRKNFIVISFSHNELFEFSEYCPSIPVYVLEHRNGFDAINAARVYGFNGIDLNFWTLNPLVYYVARRHNLEIVVYTIDKVWVAKLFRKLYPKVSVTTNVPNLLQELRK